MAVNTTLRRGSDNRFKYATMNIYVTSSTGIAAGGVLTLTGDLAVTVIHELPNLGWKTEVTGMPVTGARHRVKQGDTVTG